MKKVVVAELARRVERSGWQSERARHRALGRLQVRAGTTNRS